LPIRIAHPAVAWSRFAQTLQRLGATPRSHWRVGVVTRVSLLVLPAGLLIATSVASFIEARMTDLLLMDVASRASDQVQLGIAHHVTPSDFEPPYTAAKLEDLAARLDPLLARARQEGSGILRLNLFARDGTIVYSDLASLRGQVVSPLTREPLAAALAGRPGVHIGELNSPENTDLGPRYGRAVEAYVPFSIDRRVVGAYELYQDLAPIRPIRPLVWGVVIAGLACGFLVQVLALRAVARAVGHRQLQPADWEVPGLGLTSDLGESESKQPIPTRPVRVVVAEGSVLARGLLATLLSSEPDLRVVAEVADGVATFEAVSTHRPDVLLLDSGLPGLDSLTVARVKVVSPATRVVVLNGEKNLVSSQAGFPPEVDAYVPRAMRPRELLAALRVAVRGEPLLPAPPAGRGPDYELTPRELEVLRLLATNSTYREIAERLVIGEETVRSHAKSILHKLGQPDRMQAVLAALQAGLLDLPALAGSGGRGNPAGEPQPRG
jgi:DNA-binding NarL/FixJ family response regulator